MRAIIRRKKAAAIAAATLIALASAAGIAWAAVSNGPAPQVNSPDVYACVNQGGGIDYLEFRVPIPHPCWFASETLWRWSVNPVPAPTVTTTAG